MTDLPASCHRCPFGERHMRETVCTLDGRCVSLPDVPPEWCPLRRVATLRRERDEGRSVIAAAVAALGSRSTGDLAADVAGVVELAGRDQSAEIADLRDSLDRLRALADECQLECQRPRPATDPLAAFPFVRCNECSECRLRAEVSRVE